MAVAESGRRNLVSWLWRQRWGHSASRFLWPFLSKTACQLMWWQCIYMLQHTTDFEDVCMNVRFSTAQWPLLSPLPATVIPNTAGWGLCQLQLLKSSQKRREAVMLHCQPVGKYHSWEVCDRDYLIHNVWIPRGPGHGQLRDSPEYTQTCFVFFLLVIS